MLVTLVAALVVVMELTVEEVKLKQLLELPMVLS